MARRIIYCVAVIKDSVARRFIYCVSLIGDRSGSKVYLLYTPNGREEWLVDLSIVCP